MILNQSFRHSLEFNNLLFDPTTEFVDHKLNLIKFSKPLPTNHLAWRLKFFLFSLRFLSKLFYRTKE